MDFTEKEKELEEKFFSFYPKIDYELEEHGRIEEVLLWEIMNRFIPKWRMFDSANYFILFMIESYNYSNKRPLDSDKIFATFNKIKKVKLKPTKAERIHTLGTFRLSWYKIGKVLGTKGELVKKIMNEDLDPFEDRRTEFYEDLYLFNRYLMERFRGTYFLTAGSYRFRKFMKKNGVNPLTKQIEDDIIEKPKEAT